MKKAIPTLLVTFLLAFTTQLALAGSATWNLNPASGDWNTAVDWTPNTVPNGATDIATFDLSNTTEVGVSAKVLVDSIVFDPGAAAYNITLGTGSIDTTLTIDGAGIVNNSGVTQMFTLPRTTLTAPEGNILFTNEATAGVMTVFNNGEGVNELASEEFRDSSSADHATFINNGPPDSNVPFTAGQVLFDDTSTAGNAIIMNNSGMHLGGQTVMTEHATAGEATVICNGATAPQERGGLVMLEGNASGENATFIVNGSDFAQKGGGLITLLSNTTFSDATVIVNGGAMNAGHVLFYFPASGGDARVELNGNGEMDFTGYNQGSHVVVTTIGSLEGDGLILNSANLTTGSNSLSTTFSGVIQDNLATVGAITKVGPGSLTLTGASTYSGGTTVNAGGLVVSNQSGSGTGTGPVTVSGGTLGGSGIIAGATTVGRGSGSSVFLAPGVVTNEQITLTIEGALTLQSDAIYTYSFEANRNHAHADLVIANGVTINGSTLDLTGRIKGSLKQGLTLTVISNTSATAISGNFTNLADGAVVTIGGANFQANYEGGDGNDLTLTVVP